MVSLTPRALAWLGTQCNWGERRDRIGVNRGDRCAGERVGRVDGGMLGAIRAYTARNGIVRSRLQCAAKSEHDKIGRVEICPMITENGRQADIGIDGENPPQCSEIVVLAVCPWVPGLASFIAPGRDRSYGKVVQKGWRWMSNTTVGQYYLRGQWKAH